HTLRVHDRSPEPVRELAAEGALAAGSAAKAADEVDLVLTALPTTETVEAVYRELAASASAGQVYADHSTVNLRLNRLCAELLRENGADFLDAPVSGGPAGAAAGTLTVMVGGEQAAYDRALPVF